MSQYRYVGGAPAQILYTPYEFRSFGQLVEIPDDLAEHAIKNRIHLVPADVFAARFSPDELRMYSRFETHGNAPDSFKQKLVAIWIEAQDLHVAVKNGVPAAAPLNTDQGGD